MGDNTLGFHPYLEISPSFLISDTKVIKLIRITKHYKDFNSKLTFNALSLNKHFIVISKVKN